MSTLLIIKSPNQLVEDLKVDCESTWTVGQLKDHLSSHYPTKLEKKEQKIIYCGKILQDHSVIDNVLNKSLDVQTMHLVCPQSTCSNNSSEVNFLKKIEQSKKTNNEYRNIPSFNNHQVSSPQQNILNSTPLQSYLPYAPMYPNNAQYSPYQLLAMQQYYCQVISHYVAHYPESLQRYLELTNQRQPAEIANPPRVANVIEEDPFVDEDGNGADILDFALVCLETGILLAILLHSTTGRILSAIGIAFFFRLYRACRAYFSNEPERLNNNRQNTLNPEPDLTNISSRETTGSSLFSGVKLVFTFVKTLFTSLIPE